MCSLKFRKTHRKTLVPESQPATLLKKRLWDRCFPVNFARFLRTPFLTEHLWWLLLTIPTYFSSRGVFRTLSNICALTFCLSSQWIFTTPENLRKLEHSVLQDISPTLKYWRHPFLPKPSQKNSKSFRPTPPPPTPLNEQPPQNFGELYSPLKCTLSKKQRLIF